MAAHDSNLSGLAGKRFCLATNGGVLVASVGDKTFEVMQPRGAPSGDAWCLARDHSEAAILYAGYLDAGIFRSVDGGDTWENCTPEKAAGEEIWSLSSSPWKRGTVYAGTSGPKLFKSANEGESWDEMGGIRDVPGAEHLSFPEPPHIAHIRSIAFDPIHEEVLYLGVEEGGVLRTDNEREWEPLNDGLYEDVHTVLPSPRDPDRLYTATGAGLYLSENGGLNWEISDTGDRPYVVPVVVDPRNSSILFTAAAATPPPGWEGRKGAGALVFKSTDEGKSWETAAGKIFPLRGMVMSLSFDPNDPHRLYGATSNGEILIGQDDGSSWEIVGVTTSRIRALVVL